MANILYSHAIDENNNIVSIHDIDKDTCSGRVFTCLSCGQPMIARIGTKRQPHFAHKIECDCSPESYIHQLAKHIIKTTFDNSKTYEIEINRSHKCAEYASCPLFLKGDCSEIYPEKYDLKQYYQIATEEKMFDGFRADILLESTSNHQPIFFEIKYRHACTADKIASNNRIIEIDVESENELNSLLNTSVLRDSRNIRFYNFNTVSKQTSTEVKSFTVQNFSLFKSTKARVFNYNVVCNEQHSDLSIFEITMRQLNDSQISAYDIGYVAALDAHVIDSACHLCKYRKESYNLEYGPNFCCMYKLRADQNRYPHTREAQFCEFYKLDESRINTIREKMKQIPLRRIK